MNKNQDNQNLRDYWIKKAIELKIQNLKEKDYQ